MGRVSTKRRPEPDVSGRLQVNHRTKQVLSLDEDEADLVKSLARDSSQWATPENADLLEELTAGNFLSGAEPAVASRAVTVSLSHFDVPVGGRPEIPSRGLYERSGRHLFHPVAVARQVLLGLSGLLALLSVSSEHRSLHLLPRHATGTHPARPRRRRRRRARNRPRPGRRSVMAERLSAMGFELLFGAPSVLRGERRCAPPHPQSSASCRRWRETPSAERLVVSVLVAVWSSSDLLLAPLLWRFVVLTASYHRIESPALWCARAGVGCSSPI